MKIPYKWLKEYVNTKLEPKEVARILTLAGHALDRPIYEQGGDVVMDFEDRGNRADVAGIVGVARDLAALTGGSFSEPEVEEIPPVRNDDFKISVDSNKVLRFTAVTFKNVRVGKSPEWLRSKLESYGIESKNNVVDITNFVMIELGMPLHAFDLDKIKKLELRAAKKGEKLITFEGTTLEFDENDLIAADGDKPLSLTTAVGGAESGVTSSTKNILIEAGLYDQPTARRSALRLGVRNETSQRLGKYLHPKFCELAIARTIKLMKDVAMAPADKTSYDFYPNKQNCPIVDLTKNRLQLISGDSISLDEAADSLAKLGFLINGKKGDILSVAVPYFRTDVTMDDDLIEEVLRIRGLDKLPSQMPPRPAPEKLTFPNLEQEAEILDAACKLGFTQVISFQIVDEKDLDILGKSLPLVRLQNSWNKELNVLRPTMTLGLLRYLSSYKKHGADKVQLIETGNIYYEEGPNYKEEKTAGLVCNTSFDALKGGIERIFREVGAESASFNPKHFDEFKKGVSAEIRLRGIEIGRIGEIRRKVLSGLNLEGSIFYAELSIEKLTKLTRETTPKILTSIPNLVSEDITFSLKPDEPLGPAIDKIKDVLSDKAKIKVTGAFLNEKEGKKNVTVNFRFQNSSGASDLTRKLKDLRL